MEFLNSSKLNIQFTKYFKPLGILSILLAIASIASFFAPGLNYGIDFRGGIEAQIAFEDTSIDIAKVRAALDSKVPNANVVRFEDVTNTKEYMITAQGDSKEQVSNLLSSSLVEAFGPAGEAWQVKKLDYVGPKVGSELRKSALLSILYTCILITLYLFFRFDIRYSPGALLSIFHDLILTIGFIVLTQMEFSVTIVAALLTLAGYSINDTVVVFDRIRETEVKAKGRDKPSLINLAINSTLSRTILTSLTTLFACAVLYFVGGNELRDFATVLFFGVLVGTYSSSFVAAPLYLFTDKVMTQKELASA